MTQQNLQQLPTQEATLDFSSINVLGLAALPIINVKEYGAVGDGVHDDTPNIQEAINAAAPDRIVFFPETSDYYKVTSTLNSTQQQLIGCGPSSVISGTASPFIAVAFSAQTSVDSKAGKIKGLEFLLTGANQKAITVSAAPLNALGNSNFILDDCGFDFSACSGSANWDVVAFTDLSGAIVDSCRFYGNRQSTVRALALYGCSGTTVSKVRVYRAYYGLYVDKSADNPWNDSLLALGVYMFGCFTGMYFGASFDDSIVGCTIEQNYYECVYTHGATIQTFSGCEFYCVADANSGKFVMNLLSDPVQITGGTLIYQQNNGNGGIFFRGQANGGGCVVDGVNFSGNYASGGTLVQYQTPMGAGNAVQNCLFNVSSPEQYTVFYPAGDMAAQNGKCPALVIRNNIYADNQSANLDMNAGNFAPAVPAASTWLWNPLPYAVRVFISGGTGVSISIAGPNGSGSVGTAIATGLASGSVILNAGEAINLGAYTGAPTWTWMRIT